MRPVRVGTQFEQHSGRPHLVIPDRLVQRRVPFVIPAIQPRTRRGDLANAPRIVGGCGCKERGLSTRESKRALDVPDPVHGAVSAVTFVPAIGARGDHAREEAVDMRHVTAEFGAFSLGERGDVVVFETGQILEELHPWPRMGTVRRRIAGAGIQKGVPCLEADLAHVLGEIVIQAAVSREISRMMHFQRAACGRDSAVGPNESELLAGRDDTRLFVGEMGAVDSIPTTFKRTTRSSTVAPSAASTMPVTGPSIGPADAAPPEASRNETSRKRKVSRIVITTSSGNFHHNSTQVVFLRPPTAFGEPAGIPKGLRASPTEALGPGGWEKQAAFQLDGRVSVLC